MVGTTVRRSSSQTRAGELLREAEAWEHIAGVLAAREGLWDSGFLCNAIGDHVSHVDVQYSMSARLLEAKGTAYVIPEYDYPYSDGTEVREARVLAALWFALECREEAAALTRTRATRTRGRRA